MDAELVLAGRAPPIIEDNKFVTSGEAVLPRRREPPRCPTVRGLQFFLFLQICFSLLYPQFPPPTAPRKFWVYCLCHFDRSSHRSKADQATIAAAQGDGRGECRECRCRRNSSRPLCHGCRLRTSVPVPNYQRIIFQTLFLFIGGGKKSDHERTHGLGWPYRANKFRTSRCRIPRGEELLIDYNAF